MTTIQLFTQDVDKAVEKLIEMHKSNFEIVQPDEARKALLAMIDGIIESVLEDPLWWDGKSAAKYEPKQEETVCDSRKEAEDAAALASVYFGYDCAATPSEYTPGAWLVVPAEEAR